MTTDEIDQLNIKIKALCREKSADALEEADRACRLSVEISYRRGYIEALLNHARALSQHGAFHEAIALMRHAHDMADEEGLAQIAADCLQEVARAYFTVAEYDTALEYWSRCLDVSQQVDAHEAWLQALIGLGQIYYAHADFAAALTHHQWALNNWRNQDDPRLRTVLCTNVGIDLYQLQRPEDALAILLLGLEIARNYQNLEGESDALGIIGLVRLAQGEADKAEIALAEALALNHQRGHALGIATNLLSLGRLCLVKQDLSRAQTLLSEALVMAESMATPHLIFQIEQALASIYEAQGEWQQALIHFKRYHEQQQTLLRQASPHRLQAMELKLEMDRARQENLRLRHQQATERREKSRFERMAFEDPLTGILNRRGLEQQADVVLPALANAGTSLCVLMIDIDHFKIINDTCGHASGDAVLRQTAALLKSGCRQNDLVARWGGEEFVVLLQGRDQAGGNEVAERLRSMVESWPWSKIAPEAMVTISVGVVLRGQEAELLTLVNRADNLMYRAKREGRNRVVS